MIRDPTTEELKVMYEVAMTDDTQSLFDLWHYNFTLLLHKFSLDVETQLSYGKVRESYRDVRIH